MIARKLDLFFRPDAAARDERIELDLASRSSRIFALLVDKLVYLPCVLPMFLGNAIELYSDFGTPLDRMGQLGFGLTLALVSSIVATQIYLLHRNGWTIGKRSMGIKIVRRSGERAAVGRLLWRQSLIYVLPAWVPSVGLLFATLDVWSFFRADRRCLHDMLADTVVVRA